MAVFVVMFSDAFYPNKLGLVVLALLEDFLFIHLEDFGALVEGVGLPLGSHQGLVGGVDVDGL